MFTQWRIMTNHRSLGARRSILLASAFGLTVGTAAAEGTTAMEDGRVYYKPGSGITAETHDGSFESSVGARLQTRYSYETFEADEAETLSSFQIRAMKLWLKGHAVRKALGYKLQLNYGDGKPNLEDAYAQYTVSKWLVLRVGQFKPPQGRQELTSSGRQRFVDRSLANETFNLGRDVGMQFGGQVADHLLEYRLGVFNGNGPRRKANVGNDHLFAGRVDVNPFGKYKMSEVRWDPELRLNAGGSVAYGKLSAADAGQLDADNDVFDMALDIDGFAPDEFTTAFGESVDVRLTTANLNLAWMGAGLAAEFFHLDVAPETGDSFTATGYYVQAGYALVPKTLGVGAGYSAIESSADNATKAFDASEIQLVINYYLLEHIAKVQADFSLRRDDLHDSADAKIARLQAQIIF